MELLLTIVVAVTCYALAKRSMDQKEKARADNVRLLEEALRNPQLDRHTVEALAGRLTHGGGRVGMLSAMFLFVGWIGLFVAAGLLVGASYFASPQQADDMRLGGWITGLCAFGCLSYPFALRELEARRRA